MDNYGEELAYWYLRLNGFFPISNFVLHSLRNDTSGKRIRADVDLLAIRPPNACEEIEGIELNLDSKIVPENEQSNYIFVYCEVKTGDYNVNELFPENRIEYVRKRCGAPSTSIKKVLIANEKKDGLQNDIMFISLNDVLSFICDRFKQYDEYKYPSRMFFKSSLIQLLIHEAKKQRAS